MIVDCRLSIEKQWKNIQRTTGASEIDGPVNSQALIFLVCNLFVFSHVDFNFVNFVSFCLPR